MRPLSRGASVIIVEKFVRNPHGKVFSAREIGERRISELNLRTVGSHIVNEIDVVELGTCSIRNIPVMVALVGLTAGQAWRIVAYTKENIDKYFGHCYVIKGRKIRHIGGRYRSANLYEAIHEYEAEETGKALKYMGAQEIFATCTTRRMKQKVTTKVREGGTVKEVIVCRRFENSRITCVCKSRKVW
jgi:hypothetical protein